MKKENNSGVALYLVVVFVAIATSLLVMMYSKMSATGISQIHSANYLQEKLYLESASELLRKGYSDEEITKYIKQIGGEEITIEREDEDVSEDVSEENEDLGDNEIEIEYVGNYVIKMENSIWQLHFSLQEGYYTNYYFKESE